MPGGRPHGAARLPSRLPGMALAFEKYLQVAKSDAWEACPLLCGTT